MMKSFAIMASASAVLVFAQAPVQTYSYTAVPTLIPGQENTWQCPESNMNYCMPGGSIIMCNGTALGVGHNCNDEVGEFENDMENAFCYQPTSGIANCAVSGTVYGLSTTYAIPTTTPPPATTTGPPMPSLISGAGNAYSCPTPNANYCPDGVGANLIIWCNSTGLGEAHNCNDVLDEYENPYAENAYCYDATPGDGMAACAVSGYAFASTATYAVPIPSMYQSLQSLSAPSNFPYPSSSYSSSSSPAPTGAPMPTLIPGQSNAFSCPAANAQYCVAPDIIVYCNSSSIGLSGNCNDILDRYENPLAENAYCYDATAGDGMAACALSGYAFASTGTFAVPVPTEYQGLDSSDPAPSNFPYPMSSTGLSTDCSTPTPPPSSTSMQIISTSPPSSTSMQSISTPPASTSVLQGQGVSNTHYAAAGIVAAVGLLGLAL